MNESGDGQREDPEKARLREEARGAKAVLEAWFDRRKIAHEAVDEAVKEAVGGYLRRCMSGGMPKREAETIHAVVSSMADRSVFADVFARYALHPDVAETATHDLSPEDAATRALWSLTEIRALSATVGGELGREMFEAAENLTDRIRRAHGPVGPGSENPERKP